MSTNFLKKYKVLGKIGEGSFSEVLKCQDRETGVLYAAKRLKKIKQTITEVLQISEVVAMRKLKEHPNILHMIESHFDPLPGKVTLIFELMDMSMYDLLKSRKRCLPESRVKNYLYQILKAVDHIHQHGLFHRDIKPENILLKVQTGLVKLADLGSVRGIFCRPPYTEYISTRWYRSPECLLTTGFYGPKMDVWATGCVFFELLTLKPLFPGGNEVDQLSKIHNILGTPNQRLIAKFRRHKSQNCEYIFPAKSGTGFYNMLPNASEAGQDILRHMLVYDPELRSNTRRLLEHRYFNDLREKEILFPRRRSWSVNPNSNSKNNEWRNPVLLSYMMASEKRRKHKRISTNRHSTEKKPVPRVVVSSPGERCSPRNALKEAAARQKLLKHTLGVTELTKHPPPCQYSRISKLKQGEPIHSEVVHLPNIVQQKTEKGNSQHIVKKSSVLNRPARVPNTITSLPVLETFIKDRHKTASNSFPLVKKLDPNLHSNMRNPHNGVQTRPGVVPTLSTIEESPNAKKLHHALQAVVNYNMEFTTFVTGWPDLPMTVEFSTAAESVASLRDMKCLAFSWGIMAMGAITI